VTQWFENEDFWRQTYPVMFPASRFESAADEVERLLALAGLRAGHVLDLCCGPGRHSVELASRGFRVTGVDQSKFLLAKARERAREVGVDIEFVHEDMRRFCRCGAYHLALSLFTSFGYFEDEEDNFVVLENLYTSLGPGGTLVVEVQGKEALARKFQPTGVSESLHGGTVLVERREVVRDWQCLRNHWTVLQDGKVAGDYCFPLWVYSGRELRELLARTGFANVELFGGLDGGPYDINASRLVAVARKGI
jgi:SAM-dependent methyltransferase